MSMHLEAFMPCLGEVDVCVETREVDVPEGCCPGMQQDSARIITKGATYQAEFTINYSGTLFDLLDGEKWKVSAWLENVGGIPDNNQQTAVEVDHVVPAPVGGLVKTISFNWSGSRAGNIYKPVFKAELIVNNVLLVCAFGEGPIIHFNEA